MRRENATIFSIAPLSCLIFAVNIALYLICAQRSGSLTLFTHEALLSMGGSWREGLWDNEWLRLIAPSFLHVGFMHILINSLALQSMGPSAEVHFGSPNFGTLYVLSGAGGFALSQLCGGYLAVGASAPLFGILGAELSVVILKCPRVKYAWRNSDVRRHALWVLIYFGIGVLGLMGNVDNWGHLGGFLTGLLLGGTFELWRLHRHLGLPALLASLLLVAALLAAARWPFFNPYYHIYKGAEAAEELHDQRQSDDHFAEAAHWATFWKRKADEYTTPWFIENYRAGNWKLKDARAFGIYGIYMAVRNAEEEKNPPQNSDAENDNS